VAQSLRRRIVAARGGKSREGFPGLRVGDLRFQAPPGASQHVAAGREPGLASFVPGEKGVQSGQRGVGAPEVELPFDGRPLEGHQDAESRLPLVEGGQRGVSVVRGNLREKLGELQEQGGVRPGMSVDGATQFRGGLVGTPETDENPGSDRPTLGIVGDRSHVAVSRSQGEPGLVGEPESGLTQPGGGQIGLSAQRFVVVGGRPCRIAEPPVELRALQEELRGLRPGPQLVGDGLQTPGERRVRSRRSGKSREQRNGRQHLQTMAKSVR
jgi:hypothetical protein